MNGQQSKKSSRRKKTKSKNLESSIRRMKNAGAKKSKSGTGRSKNKKEVGEGSMMSVETVEAPTIDRKKEKKREPWSGDEAVKRLMAGGLLNLESIIAGFTALSSPKPSAAICDRFVANEAKCRQPEFPISNEKLIKITNAPDSFIAAARVTVPEYKRTVVISQLPDNLAGLETFWRMIFQEEVLSMVLCQAPLESALTLQQILPTASGSFAQHGKMFLNNRKVDASLTGVTIYNIEVLPDGCSNSIHVLVYHLNNWKQKKALDGTAGQPVCDLVSTLDKIIKTNENTSFVSVNGIGRSGTAMTVFAMMVQILKETKDQKSLSVKETLEKLRSERCGLVDNLEQYQMIHKCLAFWIRSKASDEEILKKVHDYAPNIQ